ncbi:MAG: hypothetical protein M1822_001059 [Bathelium mastoideum]|nr:MAG: hypothetical protein M1822_001059 [Bathelium mastoideum]
MDNLDTDLMWQDRSEVYSKQSWSEFPDVIVLSESEFHTCPTANAQQGFDFLSTDQGSEMFEPCQSPHRPRLSQIPIPPVSDSPNLGSTPDLSPDAVPGYPASYTSSPAQSHFDDVKIQAQSNNSRSTARRRDQNRAAQRAFRERREQHLKTLEGRVQDTEENYRELQLTYQKLEEAHKEAQKTIERQNIELQVFRSVVKCGYRPCECTENGEIKSCVIDAALKGRPKIDGESHVKEEDRSISSK